MWSAQKNNKKNQNSKIKKFICFSFLWSIFLTSPFLSFAENLQMIFIVPGGEGSTELAQPVLNHFLNLIEKNEGPKISGAYYSDFNEGLKALKNKNALLGILSLDAYADLSMKQTMDLFLATIPVSSNQASEIFYVYSNKKNKNPKTLYTPRNYPNAYLKIILKKFENSGELEITPVENLLSTLKAVGRGEKEGFVLLDHFQNASIKNLKSDWKNNLQEIHKSQILPSSPFVLFGNINAAEKTKLKNVLLNFGKNEEETEILQNLRLSGFKEPDSQFYLNFLDEFYKIK